jgi:hypothetical protein
VTSWATGGGIKVERAKEHIFNLEAEIASFVKRRPYSSVAHKDPQTGDIVYTLRIAEHPSPRWGAMAGDAIHNLRSALDILWRHVMGVAGKPSRGDSGFPIHETANALIRMCEREAHGRAKAPMDILKALKPYKGGTDLLWLLHTADISDKHHLLIPCYGSAGMPIVTPVKLGVMVWGATFPVRDGPESICPVEDGTVLFRLPRKDIHDEEVNVNKQVPIHIAFGEIDGLHGQPIIPTLYQFASCVDGVIDTFRVAGLVA